MSFPDFDVEKRGDRFLVIQKTIHQGDLYCFDVVGICSTREEADALIEKMKLDYAGPKVGATPKEFDEWFRKGKRPAA